VLQRLVGAAVPPIRTTPHQSADSAARSQHSHALREQGAPSGQSPEDTNGASSHDKDVDALGEGKRRPQDTTGFGGNGDKATEGANKGAASQGALLPLMLRRLVRERWNATYGPGSLNAVAAASVAAKASCSGRHDERRSDIRNSISISSSSSSSRSRSNTSNGDNVALDSKGLTACPLLPAPFNGQRQVITHWTHLMNTLMR